ncbi:MAG: hypothetical protein WBL68_00900 [Nitrososphaeraceae archaeon]
MIDFQRHFDRLQRTLCVKSAVTGKNCVDKIDEQLWQDEVMPVINKISFETADELQEETWRPYPKDSTLKFEDAEGQVIHVKSIEEFRRLTEKLDPYESILKDSNGEFIGVRRNLKYSEAPPMRLLSMTLNLCYFLGFLDASANHEMDEDRGIGALKRIEEAYNKGKEAHSKSKSTD